MWQASLALLVPSVLASIEAPVECSAASIPNPTLPGAKIVSLLATQVANFTLPTDASKSISFCNVSIIYTHPGQHDRINAQVWLPSKHWNGRFQGVGGGGLTTGLNPAAMGAAVGRGYAAGSTNGGHDASTPAEKWGLLSPGNVNMYLLQDFASVSLNDMTVLGKAVTASFYGTKPKFSYWNGCSTGGRQGFMLAQRYPDAYDGILAGAPAVNWARFVPASSFSRFYASHLQRTGNAPASPCEINGLVKAAMAACDGLDGLVDGIIGAPGLCKFDASKMIGREVNCTGTAGTGSKRITNSAAKFVQAAFTGSRTAKGYFHWYSTGWDALQSLGLPAAPPAPLPKSPGATPLKAPPAPKNDFLNVFVAKNPNLDVSNITYQEWDRLMHASYQIYGSVIDTSDPDLSEFRAAGGRLLTWHGLADPVIPFNGTVHYVNHVKRLDPSYRDFMRFFLAPGVGHCRGGLGASPDDPLSALVKWVEKKEAPTSLSASVTKENGKVWKRQLCEYPAIMKYVGGDPSLATSFKCE